MQNDIKKALEVLKSGGVILYPTDTIWGLGCDATNPEAVQKIYKIKKREDSKSMLVLMENPALLERYVDEVPEVAWDLVEISTTPLTVIYPGAKNLAANLIASDGSVGIRFTKEDFTTRLLQRFRRPIVSTSANISGEKAPAFFDEISEDIKEQADYIVEYRQDDVIPAQPSSIIKLGPGGQIDIIRK
ncbi:L-threonylcarbamoyladenylate synthase [Tangfeifania diversioriginum]|uniref:L-threonylcarbamoyladenylate synthase n=1 Tax=Tangfeifania diversioriginum TaxID=1168035 RepID=A0A1M6IJR3_9BACT|nr:L-threonylcarbamoyladenylate synthase [Tangfeifania diversioriginum]SHJ34711.1 L-threonylcarbamoyladenylate synthase [Tangfeifania diversioriginum]